MVITFKGVIKMTNIENIAVQEFESSWDEFGFAPKASQFLIFAAMEMVTKTDSVDVVKLIHHNDGYMEMIENSNGPTKYYWAQTPDASDYRAGVKKYVEGIKSNTPWPYRPLVIYNERGEIEFEVA